MTNEEISKKQDDELQTELEHGRELLRLAIERRRRLELQSAKYGTGAPAHLQVQLDQTRKEIQEMEEQLRQMEVSVQARGEQPLADQARILETGTLFTPKWSVLRSHVQYVDANLAYRFADASEDVNIMLGFTTLFLGAGLSFATSLVTAQTSSGLVLFGTSTGFSALLTIVFGILTIRASHRAKKVKKQLLASGETGQDAKVVEKKDRI